MPWFSLQWVYYYKRLRMPVTALREKEKGRGLN